MVIKASAASSSVGTLALLAGGAKMSAPGGPSAVPERRSGLAFQTECRSGPGGFPDSVVLLTGLR